MNIDFKIIAIGTSITFLYFAPLYMLKKYSENKYEYLSWRFNALRDEVKTIAKSLNIKVEADGQRKFDDELFKRY